MKKINSILCVVAISLATMFVSCKKSAPIEERFEAAYQKFVTSVDGLDLKAEDFESKLLEAYAEFDSSMEKIITDNLPADKVQEVKTEAAEDAENEEEAEEKEEEVPESQKFKEQYKPKAEEYYAKVEEKLAALRVEYLKANGLSETIDYDKQVSVDDDDETLDEEDYEEEDEDDE